MTVRTFPACVLRPLLPLAACAGLAACATAPLPPLPVGDLPAVWRNAAFETKAPAPDLHGWWKAFNDPQLNTLVDQALHDNLDVQQAALHLRAARELEDVSGAAYKPQLAFNTLSTPTPQADADYFQAGFDAEWELGLFGRAQADARVAKADADTAAAELQSARVSLVGEVVREYLQLRAAQASKDLLAIAAQAAERKASLVGIRNMFRLASQLDVGQAAAAQAKLYAPLADATAAIAQHAQALALLLGNSEPDPAWLLAPKPLPKLADFNVVSVPADLLRTRPEIARAQAQVLKAAGELGIAHADRFPRIGLGGAITWSSKVNGVSLGNTNHTSGIGPVLDIPLFDWGMRAAAERARNDELKAVLLAYRQAVLQGAAEVETDLAALHASDQRVYAANDIVAASQHSLAAHEKLQELGLADDLQLNASRQEWAESEVEREQAQLAHDLAYVALYKALGGAPLPEAHP